MVLLIQANSTVKISVTHIVTLFILVLLYSTVWEQVMQMFFELFVVCLLLKISKKIKVFFLSTFFLLDTFYFAIRHSIFLFSHYHTRVSQFCVLQGRNLLPLIVYRFLCPCMLNSNFPGGVHLSGLLCLLY